MPSNTKGTTRDGFGQGMVELGHEDGRVVGLCADLTDSTRINHFAANFPDRFFECGVAEENMVGVAAGLALAGQIPYVASYATFCPQNAMGPLRASVCYSNLPVKIIGGHAGITIGPDGATHQALEDIALMRTLPNMQVVVPCDQEESHKATLALINYSGPSYLRTSKYETKTLTDQNTPFTIGKAIEMKHGTDITIIACGHMVAVALEAARTLDEQDVSVRVINMHTIKPLDVEAITRVVTETKAIVTVEENQVAGGLGSAVAEVVCQLPHPVPMKIIGVEDRFGQSGTAEELLREYGLTKERVVVEVRKILDVK